MDGEKTNFSVDSKLDLENGLCFFSWQLRGKKEYHRDTIDIQEIPKGIKIKMITKTYNVSKRTHSQTSGMHEIS